MKKITENLKHDIPASVIVFLVALPLCLGIALASGAPLFSGLIAGIVGGIVIGIASGSALGVSGPAAGLAVIVLAGIENLGFEVFLVSVVIAGFLQIVLGYIKAGIIGYYFPTSVIKGMLSGIGLILILKQIPHALGFDSDYEGDLSFIQMDGENTFSAIAEAFTVLHPGAIAISFVCLAILILWEQKFMKKLTFTTYVQGPLVSVIAGIVLFWYFDDSASMFQLNDSMFVSLPVAGSLTEFFSFFTLPDFSAIGNFEVYTTAFTIAIVASLETLLSVEAIDKLDPYKRLTPTNRELKAQGLGNMISGFIGGLPITQVIVRSSANVQSGGKTKMSAIIHGFMLLFSVLLVPELLNVIPLASLAAILIYIGYKLAKPELFIQMYKNGWSQIIPFVATITGILLTDLLIGIFIGMAVALFFILLNNYRVPFFFDKESYKKDKVIHIVLAEDVSFLNKASVLLTLKKLPSDCKVIIDATKSTYLDFDVVDIIEEFKENAKYKNIDYKIIGVEKKKMQHDHPHLVRLEPETAFEHPEELFNNKLEK